MIDTNLECLFNLPDVKDRYKQEDSDYLALIPIFHDPYSSIANVYAYAQSAAWSRYTCLKNTDAFNIGIAVKLYVEEKLRDALKPIFEKNQIDPVEDVIYFNAPPLEHTNNGVWGRLGKKLVSYWDDRFSNKHWIIAWDADIFWLENDFFRHLAEYPKEIGYIKLSTTHKAEKILHRNTELSGLIPKAIINMCGIQELPDSMEKTIGYQWVYPARRYHREYSDILEWLWQYGPYIGDDELVMAFMRHLFNLPIFSLEDKGRKAMTTKDYITTPFTDCNFIHGRPREDQIEQWQKILTSS